MTMACANVAPDAEQPAIIVDPNDASRAALQAAVNSALNTDVTLADSALTDTSLLIIERQIPRTMDGAPAGGRTMESPFQFHLVTDGTNCILIDGRNESRYVLADTRCVSERAPAAPSR